MQKYKWHTECEEEDRKQRTHDDKHCRLARRHTRVTQEHDLRHRAARCPRCEERKEIIAEDYLYCLVQGDFFVGDLNEVHEAAAVKEHAQPDGKECEEKRP